MLSSSFKVALVKEVFKSEWAYINMHDIVFEALGESITEEEAQVIFYNLPETVQCDALKEGLSDTEVRDQIYTHLKKVNDNG